MDKSKLRKILLNKRDSFVTEKEQLAKINHSVLPKISGAQYIHCYLPLPNEVDIWPTINELLEYDRTVVVPKVIGNHRMTNLILNGYQQLAPGNFKLLHPTPEIEYFGSFDAILVPD